MPRQFSLWCGSAEHERAPLPVYRFSGNTVFPLVLKPSRHEHQIPMPQMQISVTGGATQTETARHTERQDRLRAPRLVVMPPASRPIEIRLETARREHTPGRVLE